MTKFSPTALSSVALAACSETDHVWSPTTPSTATPPNTYFLMKAAKIDKGSQTVGKSAPVGQLTMSQLREIAEQKMKDMNANDVEGAVRMLMGSARSMGITVVEG